MPPPSRGSRAWPHHATTPRTRGPPTSRQCRRLGCRWHGRSRTRRRRPPTRHVQFFSFLARFLKSEHLGSFWLVWFVQRHVLMLLHEWIWLNQHEHEESNQFRFGEKNYILARDLKFPEFEFELRHDSFGIAYQLHGDHLCKVWERFLLIWSSFGRFPLYLSCRPSLRGCGSGFQEEGRRGSRSRCSPGAHQAGCGG